MRYEMRGRLDVTPTRALQPIAKCPARANVERHTCHKQKKKKIGGNIATLLSRERNCATTRTPKGAQAKDAFRRRAGYGRESGTVNTRPSTLNASLALLLQPPYSQRTLLRLCRRVVSFACDVIRLSLRRKFDRWNHTSVVSVLDNLADGALAWKRASVVGFETLQFTCRRRVDALRMSWDHRDVVKTFG